MKLMIRNIFVIALAMSIQACAVHLVPREQVISSESSGIVITAGQQHSSFLKDDLYTPVYITVANNTDTNLTITNNNFFLVDDKKNQYSSVPINAVLKDAKEKRRRYRDFGYNPYYPIIMPLLADDPYLYYRDWDGRYRTVPSYTVDVFAGAPGYNPYYRSLYPNFAQDPFLYYKDLNNNYTIISSIPLPGQTMPYEPKTPDPRIMALKMGTILPGLQVQGYIYFHQAVRHAKKTIRLLFHAPEKVKETLELEFSIQ